MSHRIDDKFAREPPPGEQMGQQDHDLNIVEVRAYPTSFRVRPEDSISLGVGRVVKRDSVIVKFTPAGGLTGYGESHHGRAPGAVAHVVNTTLRLLVLGRNAADVVDVRNAIYAKRLASHGTAASTCLAMSGSDLGLWDIRGKAVGWPLSTLRCLLRYPTPIYAVGVSLRNQELDAHVA